MRRPPLDSTLFPYTTLFRSVGCRALVAEVAPEDAIVSLGVRNGFLLLSRALWRQRSIGLLWSRCDLLLADRKSTRLNSSHPSISYAVFCLEKKMKRTRNITH